MLSESQVIVGTHIQYWLLGTDRDASTLWRFDEAFAFGKAPGFDFGKLRLQVFLELSVHFRCFLKFLSRPIASMGTLAV